MINGRKIFKLTETNTDFERKPDFSDSPKWSWTTKLVVGLSLVAISIWLLVQFQNFLGPLVTAFILAYLIHPIALFLKRKVKIPWRISVTIIHIIFVLIVLGLLTWGGFALVAQFQNLIQFIEKNIYQLPEIVDQLTTGTYQIGPFTLSPSVIDWDQITNEIVSAVQPILGRLGSFLGSFAAGAATTISWAVFVVLISYFLLAEAEGITHRVLNIKIERYTKDLERMNEELRRIWKAFIRGEILIVLISLILYTATLGIMGLQFFFGLALIAAIGQLIPYVGAWVTWISFGLVAFFQHDIPFGMPPGIYMIIVLAVSMVINNIIDNIIRTRIMADNLKVHPVLVLIGALIGVQLFGFIGIVVAAPIMASIVLFINYIVRKLSDQNPWKGLDTQKSVKKSKLGLFIEKVWKKFVNGLKTTWQRLFKKSPDNSKTEPEDISSEPDAN
jgi:predicted PurR-regulated permease PerM